MPFLNYFSSKNWWRSLIARRTYYWLRNGFYCRICMLILVQFSHVQFDCCLTSKWRLFSWKGYLECMQIHCIWVLNRFQTSSCLPLIWWLSQLDSYEHQSCWTNSNLCNRCGRWHHSEIWNSDRLSFRIFLNNILWGLDKVWQNYCGPRQGPCCKCGLRK